MNKKNITIGIIGPTNSGKSTLLNNIIGEKLAIVTHKSQTTRSAFKGIKIVDNTQMIFIDTPGIFDAKTKFEKTTPNKNNKIDLLIVFNKILNQNEFLKTKFELSEPSGTPKH